MAVVARKSFNDVVNIASVPHRSPFRYPGGKTWLVPYIRRWLKNRSSKPTNFIEPFAGGGIVSLSVAFEGLAQNVTLIELDEDVAAVWRTILNGRGEWLAREIVNFELNDESVRDVLARVPRSVSERAFTTIVRNRVQRGGILAPGASLMKNGENGRGVASRWYPETLEKRILAIASQRKRIRFVPGDGLEFLRRGSDSTENCYFIDPPYTVAGRRLYRHSLIDHEALFATASRLRGDFLMSYDNAPEIRELADQHNLGTATVAMKNTHHAVMKELLVGRDLSWLR